MKSFRDRNPYVVGIVTVLLLGTMTGAAFLAGLTHFFDETYEMEGVFADASGLGSGDNVRVAGVKVGRVTDIEVDRPSGNVRVEWVVDDGIEIGSEAGAEIGLQSLLGAKQLVITDPTAGDTMVHELPEEQRTVPLERTQVPVNVFELTRTATERIEVLETDKLNTLIGDLADITEDKEATVEDLLTGIREVSTAINDRDQEFEALLDQADRLSTTLADKDDEILTLLDTSQRLLDLIVERRNDLAIVLGESADAVQELDRVVSENKAEIDSILDSLHPTLDVVSANQENLDRALAWLGPGLLQQSAGGQQGPWQDIFIRTIGENAIPTLETVYEILLGEAG